VAVFGAGTAPFPPDATDQAQPSQAKEELRESVSKYWQIDENPGPAFIHVGAAVLQIPGYACAVTVRRPADKGRQEDARLPTHRAYKAR